MAAAETIDTPDGPFTIVADDDALLAAGWTTDVDKLLRLVHPSLRPASLYDGSPALERAKSLVEAYYAGDHDAPLAAPVRMRSGPFRMRAWEALRTIAPGSPATYAEFAEMAGNPRAVRAAGSACATNPLALFVPCHRVVRTGGGLGGFGYGLSVKEALLNREAMAQLPA